jgi:hypothetical protein
LGVAEDIFESVTYNDDGRSVEFRLDPDARTIWATQAQIAALFETTQPNISTHLKNVFDDNELDQTTNIKNVDIAGSSKPVRLYSLDAVISVGYRVNSRAATRFRQWATAVLRAYIEQGFVINEQMLRKRPDMLNELAAAIRALRGEEKQVFAKVRECFMIGASDYDPSSREMKSFYALLQDKFLHAITTMTASKIIMDRADYLAENMGLVTMGGVAPTVADVTVGKNYLDKTELYRLHLLSEQFLLHAETTALAGRKMTMRSLHDHLDRLLAFNEYPVFDGYKDFLKPQAEEHARRELRYYRERLAAEALGVDYEEALEDLSEG